MQAIAIGSNHDPDDHRDDDQEPILRVEGVEGTSLLASADGLLVCPCRAGSATSTHGHRRWQYGQLSQLRIDAYGPIGVIRSTIRDTGTELPLLLLEPDQITPARRSLEIIWNLMANVGPSGQAA